MTTYILHGGSSSSDHDMDHIHELIRAGYNSAPKQSQLTIFCLYFASLEEKWERYHQQDEQLFHTCKPEYVKQISVITASPHTALLKEQIVQSHILSIRGGNHLPILCARLSALPDLKQLLENKVIIASSAGVLALSSFYLSQSHGLGRGCDILPIKSITHFDPATMQDELQRLQNYGNEMELCVLREKEHYVLTF